MTLTIQYVEDPDGFRVTIWAMNDHRAEPFRGSGPSIVEAIESATAVVKKVVRRGGRGPIPERYWMASKLRSRKVKKSN